MILAEVSLVVVAAMDFGMRGGVYVPRLDDLMPLLIALPSMFVFYGAWCMRRNVRYRLAVAAAVVACVPFLSPWIFLGIPFGIWALAILWRRDVRAAFDAGP